MEDKHLDKIIKDKLGKLQEPLQPEAWDLFEQKLDQEGVGTPNDNEQLLDQTVFNKLHRLEAKYEPSHWALMAAKLNDEFYYHHKVLRYKATELALLFLLVFALATYLPHKDYGSLQTPNEIAPKLEHSNPKNNNAIQTPIQAFQNSAAAKIDDSKVVAATETSSQTTNKLPELAALKSKLEPIASPSTTDSDVGLIPPSSSTPVVGHHSLGSLNHLAAIQPATLERIHEPSSHLINLVGHTLPSNSYFSNSTGLLKALGKKAIDPLEYSIKKISVSPKLKKKSYFRIGTIGSLDYNRVTTPSTQEENVDLPQRQRYALGYSGGISLGFVRGRFELETGLIYSAKQYRAVPLLFIEGSVREGFRGEGVKDIELNMFSIPLHLKYNFFVKNRWRLYALTGLSLQVAYQANYYTADQTGFTTPNFAPAPAPLGPPPAAPPAERNLDFAKGLFEGGSFDENSYLTGNFGLGLDYYFTDRLSFIFQPTYQHSFNYFIDGIGPLHDRINTFSIISGIKVRL